MTLNQLQYFVTISDHRTFLDAAEVLNVSQAALSKSIMALEEELGVKLYDRSKRQIRRTPIDDIIYHDAKGMLSQYHTLLSHTRSYNTDMAGALSLGTLPILAQYQLNQHIKSFQDNYPNTVLTLDEQNDAQLVEGLKGGLYDLVLIRKEIIDPRQYQCFALLTDELVLLVSKKHPLAGSTSISLHTLKDQRFIFMHQKISTYRKCLDACNRAGFQPNIIRTAKMESIIGAVGVDEGVSLLYRKNIQVFNLQDVVVIPLEECITSHLVLATLKSTVLTPIQKNFIQYLKKSLVSV